MKKPITIFNLKLYIKEYMWFHHELWVEHYKIPTGQLCLCLN